jgi:hypothetical protein
VNCKVGAAASPASAFTALPLPGPASTAALALRLAVARSGVVGEGNCAGSAEALLLPLPLTLCGTEGVSGAESVAAAVLQALRVPSAPEALAESEARCGLRETSAVALAEAASGSEAETRGESLPSSLGVGCATVTLAEMVSVSDTSVGAGERVAAAALPLGVGV